MFGCIESNSMGWTCHQLGNLGTFKTGGTPSSKHEEYYNGTIPFISTPSLGSDYIDQSVAKYYITDEAINNCSTELIPENSLIIGTRINIGQSSINKDPMCTNQDIVSMMNIDYRFDPLFIKHCLDRYIPFLNSQKKGATIKGITVNLLKSLSIPKPPLEKQNQYRAFVEQVDKSKAICKQIFQSFDNLVKSRFIEMFGTDVNPKYGHIKVGEVISKKIRKVSKQFSTDSIIQYIDIASIDKDSKRILSTTEYIVNEAPSRAQQCVEEGDILLSNVRPNLKTISIVHLPGSNLVCSTGFSVLRCELYLPEYFLMAISSDSFTEHLMSKATGSSYPAITTKDVMNQTIPAAPLELQKKFSDFVRQVDKSKFMGSMTATDSASLSEQDLV